MGNSSKTHALNRNKGYPNTVSDALRMALWSGFGGVLLEGIIIGLFFLFDPLAKYYVVKYQTALLISVPIIFVAGFGISLVLSLKIQRLQG
jgi:hypothetical protein